MMYAADIFRCSVDVERTGAKIKDLRAEHNLTRQEVADYLNVSQQAVYLWECGGSMPSVDNISRLALLFGVTISDIVVSVKHDNSVCIPGKERVIFEYHEGEPEAAARAAEKALPDTVKRSTVSILHINRKGGEGSDPE